MQERGKAVWPTGTRCLDHEYCALPTSHRRHSDLLHHQTQRVPAGPRGQCWLMQEAPMGDVMCLVSWRRAKAARGKSCRVPWDPTSALLAMVGMWPTPMHVLHFHSAQHNSPIINTLDSLPESGPHSYPIHQPAGRLDMQHETAVKPYSRLP